MLKIANNYSLLNKAACKSSHNSISSVTETWAILFILAFRGTDLMCATGKLKARHCSKAVWHVEQHAQ